MLLLKGTGSDRMMKDCYWRRELQVRGCWRIDIVKGELQVTGCWRIDIVKGGTSREGMTKDCYCWRELQGMGWWRIIIIEGNYFKWHDDEINDFYSWRELQVTGWWKIDIMEGNFKWRDDKGFLLSKGTSNDGMMKEFYFVKGNFKWRDDEGLLLAKWTSSDWMKKDSYERIIKDYVFSIHTNFLSLKRILSTGGCNILPPFPSHMGPDHVSMDGLWDWLESKG